MFSFCFPQNSTHEVILGPNSRNSQAGEFQEADCNSENMQPTTVDTGTNWNRKEAGKYSGQNPIYATFYWVFCLGNLRTVCIILLSILWLTRHCARSWPITLPLIICLVFRSWPILDGWVLPFCFFCSFVSFMHKLSLLEGTTWCTGGGYS